MADPSPYLDSNGEAAGAGPDRRSPPSTPRWVKVFGIAFLVLVLLIVAMMASGHGPGRHTMPGMSGAGPSGQALLSSVAAHRVYQP